MVAVLTINSFPFPLPHQISGGLEVLLNLILIFFFHGNIPAVPLNQKKIIMIGTNSSE